MGLVTTFALGCHASRTATDFGAAADSAADAHEDESLDAEVARVEVEVETQAEVAGDVVDPVATLKEAYCRRVAEEICANGGACGCPAWNGFPALERCVNVSRDRCEQMADALAEGLANGTLSLQSERIEPCLEVTSSASKQCEIPNPALMDAVCGEIVVQTVNLGEPCTEGLVPFCAGGQGVCLGGTCKPRPGPEAPCEGPCAEGLVCVGGTCRKPAPAGESCESDLACDAGLVCIGGVCGGLRAAGSPCEQDAVCAWGARCNAGRCEAGPSDCTDAPEQCGNRTHCLFDVTETCEPLGAAGAPCENETECQKGLFCSAGACTQAPGEGAECAEAVYCAPGLACDQADSLCKQPPGSGEPCAMGPDGPFVCGPGLACIEGLCGAPPGLGQPCAALSVCAEGLGCDFRPDGSFCDHLHGLGGRCETDRICEPDLFCDFHTLTCEKRRLAGATCKDGNECAQGLTCLPDPLAGFTCEPIPGAGQPCMDRCVEGFFCRATPGAGHCLPSLCTLFAL